MDERGVGLLLYQIVLGRDQASLDGADCMATRSGMSRLIKRVHRKTGTSTQHSQRRKRGISNQGKGRDWHSTRNSSDGPQGRQSDRFTQSEFMTTNNRCAGRPSGSACASSDKPRLSRKGPRRQRRKWGDTVTVDEKRKMVHNPRAEGLRCSACAVSARTATSTNARAVRIVAVL
jgi:hypothetical protein